jgi:hypothetical protein
MVRLGESVKPRFKGGIFAFAGLTIGPDFFNNRAVRRKAPQFVPEQIEFAVGNFRLAIVVGPLVFGYQPFKGGYAFFCISHCGYITLLLYIISVFMARAVFRAGAFEILRKKCRTENTSDGGGRAGRAGLNVPGNLPMQPPSGFFSHTAI